jgi:hypothetical protein
MHAYIFRIQTAAIAIAALAACFFMGTATASAQTLFYEDFADTTLATGGSQQSGTIANGVITYNDTSATNRARFVDVQNFTDPVMTFSFDVTAPVFNVSGFDNELLFRAGNLTTANTLGSTEFVMEVILYRTATNGTTGGTRAPFANNGNESVYVVANNQASSLSFSSPIDASNVTLNANQYISYVHNKTTDTWATMKSATTYTTPTCPTCSGVALQRFGIGSSSNAHEGGFALDNVRVVDGVDFSSPGGVIIPGDVNGDGFVTIDDFNVIKDNFRQSPRGRTQGDLTGDGLVSLPDFTQWKGAFTGSGGSITGLDLSFVSVPEPSTISLLVLVSCMLTGRRARRGHN